MILFILGLIVGLVIRREQRLTSTEIQAIKQKIPLLREKATFLEPVSGKEKFKQANNISDILE